MSRYSSAVLGMGPAGYWRLGEPSGTVATDQVGAHNGTYVNSPTLGATGLLASDNDTAVTLNGTTQNVTVGVPVNIAGTSAMSMAVWVNVTPDATYRTIFHTGNVTDGSDILLFSQNTLSGVQRRTWGGGADNAYGAALSAGLHFMAITYDGTNLRLYVDGALAGGPTASSQSLTAATATLFGAGDAYLAGKVDEPAIWNRALSAGEVAQLYTAGSVLGLPWVDISLGGTDITSYVNAAEGGTTFSYARGANFDGSSESPGSAVVSVQNFGKVFNPANSGSPLASVLKIGKKVRAVAMYGAAGSVVSYPLFDGYLRRVVPGDNGFAELHCQDALHRYGRFDTSVAYVSRSINAFRAAILTDVGEATTGLATGSGPEAAVALSGADQRDALSLLSELNQATGSVHYIKPTSTTYLYTTLDRTTLETVASVETFSDVDFANPFPESLGGWDYTDEGIINSQRAAATPRVIGVAQSVWEANAVLTVNPSTTMTIWASYSDPVVNASVAVTATNAPTVTFTPFSRSAKIDIAAGGSGSSVTAIVVTAQPMAVQDSAASSLSSDSASIASYGEFTGSDVSSEWLGSPANAQGLADYTIWRYKAPRAKPQMIVNNRFPSQLQREVAEVISLTASFASVSAVRYYIRAFETAISQSGAVWQTRYDLEEAPDALDLFTVGGNAAHGVGGGTQILGY